MTQFEQEITQDYTIGHVLQTVEQIENRVNDILNSSEYRSDRFKKAQSLSNELSKAYIALKEAQEIIND